MNNNQLLIIEFENSFEIIPFQTCEKIIFYPNEKQNNLILISLSGHKTKYNLTKLQLKEVKKQLKIKK